MIMKNKRGLSDIVITLIIVLLSLVAIGLVWFVVNNLIQSGTAGVETSAKCLNINLEVKQVVCENGTTNQVCNVTISRTGTESSEIGGIKVLFIDKEDDVSGTLIDVSGNIEPLVGKKITNQDTGVANANEVSLVEITPYFTDSSGNQQLCSQTTSFNF